MSMETFFGGFTRLGKDCVACFPVQGNEAMDFLKMLGVYDKACPALRQCKKARGLGVIAGCSDFTAGPHLTVYYFIQCDGTGDLFTAGGVVLIPVNPDHDPCADAALAQMAEQAAAEAEQKGLTLFS